ncbi:MAG: hypothetical protein K0Q79_3530 [Flavipsychrobacter sp.]|jgi:hypothetical protein|nr:hypothetical protein [Flavipsychrobacter sp.]
MKKINLLLLFLLLNGIFAYAQTAVNFVGNDCAGNPHNLYSELDAGKIIVVSFVMPCATCIAPSNSAHTVAKSYATSHPGRVLFYVADDNGDTNCSTLNPWVSTYISTPPNAIFTNTAFKQTDYPGSATAMPKVVVIAGASHQVVFQQDDAVNTTNLQNAINTALATTGVQQPKIEGMNLSVFPNPAKDNISVSYSLAGTTDVMIDVYNIIGAKVLSVSKNNQPGGNHSELINFNNKLSSGIYFVKVNTEGSSSTLKFVVDK